MTKEEEFENKCKSYEFDLCLYCRDCDYIHGNAEPCQHLIDTRHGYKDGYEKGFSDGYENGKQNERELQCGKTNLLRDVKRLEKENELLKKNAIIWHKVTYFDEPDENGYITADNPAEEGREYLVMLKNRRIVISALDFDSGGYFFEDYDWEDVEAWAELPSVEVEGGN